MYAPIGVFDSGYGGLTILDKFRKILPRYDYLYLGDNARAPYGTRSFEVVYEFTRQAVFRLFDEGCHLVVLACNTASAKALRTIQQLDLPRAYPDRRVLGVIRPTVEAINGLSRNKHVGIVGTTGTILSGSYLIEIHKLWPGIQVTEEACPMWVPLVENRESDKPGADYFVQRHLNRLFDQDPQIDTLVLACTHYPLLERKIKEYLPSGVTILSQGEYVANSLADYLNRHPEIDAKCSKNGNCRFYTTESEDKFRETASIFFREEMTVKRIALG